MKISSLIMTAAILMGCATTQVEPLAAEHQVVNLLNGTALIAYNGTTDAENELILTDEANYSTNRTYINFLGDTVTPKSTNSVTGALVPVPIVGAPIWSDSDGGPTEGAAITITWAIGPTGVFPTNNVVLTFHRSVDGGLTFDDNSTNAFTVTLPVSDDALETISTNLPTTFTAGTSHIRLRTLTFEANPTDDASLKLTTLAVGGWSP